MHSSPPTIDAAGCASFLANGYLVLRDFLDARELAALQRETAALVDACRTAPPAADPHPDDFAYAPGHVTGRSVLRRIEYVVARLPSCRVLLAHPRILDGVERLIGADLLPTWDSMVLKMPGEGIAVPWHRDASTSQVGAHPIFNVDFYLDATEDDTALWVLPGSHRLDDVAAAAEVRRRSDAVHPDAFDRTGATRVPMSPGDVLLHDILLLHGSPPSRGNALRRVIYYEFRSVRVEMERGPHTPDYVPLKQRVLERCIASRRTAFPDETAYRYRPAAEFAEGSGDGDAELRVPHAVHWRRSSPRETT